MAPGLLIGAPRSGSGKTMLTLGLLRAFARSRVAVGGAKCGPDYIDPAFHAAASGRPSINLDGFAMAAPLLRGLAAEAGKGADLIVAEGAMGLFDGAARNGPGGSATGASADVARLLGWPMLLVVDASGAGQSVAATALGCIRHPRAPALAGVVANRIASPRHARLVAQGFEELGLPLLGLVSEDRSLALPSRHLGLVQAAETADLDALLDRAADRIAADCDLDRIAAAARPASPADLPPWRIPPPGQRIAVARDEAFAFFYPHLDLAWRASGAELVTFSPLADEAPPADCDACWLPGGYPELHAGRIAGNRRFLDGLRRFAGTRPVHGECGGYMVLGRTLEDGDGVIHAMADLLPVATSFATRRRTLGYRSATLREDCVLGPAGTRLGGHEFHYATITAEDGPWLFDLSDGDDRPLPPAGHRRGLVSGSFFHLIA